MNRRHEGNDPVLRTLARELRRIQGDIEAHIPADEDAYHERSSALDPPPRRPQRNCASWDPWEPLEDEVEVDASSSPPRRCRWKSLAADDARSLRRDLAVDHRIAVAEIHAQNRELEEAKRVLGQRIESLRARPREPEASPQGLRETLQELGSQGKRTQRQLQALRKDVRLLQADVGRMLFGQVDGGPVAPRDEPGPPHKVEPLEPPTHEAPVYTGGRLSAEISALRMMYARGGGGNAARVGRPQRAAVPSPGRGDGCEGRRPSPRGPPTPPATPQAPP
ncbi:tropomyosin-1, isoforms 33/34-like [Lethenteron reissneri]|uniref:tropomyosin-1, isoforms 33/34-like n=1 Tax=Lethenteron reissneri TaxID=7753 RepID=UPI002AB7DEDA|nr:tropomyosin-1, isoforms 33/34-like [Lethenteron reissneri]